MSFSRSTPALPSGPELEGALRSIGMRIGRAVAPRTAADIEVTLVAAVREALPDEYRLLGVVVAWLDVHQARVNVPRLGRVLAGRGDHAFEKAWWAAVATWLARTDARWKPLSTLHAGPRLDLDDPEITHLQIRLNGEDPRFADTPLRVHAKLLRARPSDIEEPVELAQHHPAYLRRIELGANYRADVFAALDASPDASPAAAARIVGCAYETARSSARDWLLAREARRALHAKRTNAVA